MAKFPLYLHANGQWAKSIRGRKFYFGRDKAEAIERYLAEKDHLLAGRTPPTAADDEPTLLTLANMFAERSKRRVASGQMTERNMGEYFATIRRVIDLRGKTDLPGRWTPTDFEAIREMFFQPVERKSGPRKMKIGVSVERRAAASVDGDVTRVRAFLKWCSDSQLIGPPAYGQSFSKSTVREKRLAKTARGRRDFSASDIRQTLGEASVYSKPLFLLAINGAIGATDLAGFKTDQFNGGEWLDCPRQKTGVERRIWLWPETREAIQAYFQRKKPPRVDAYADRAFLTVGRDLWVRDRQSAISQAWLKSRRAAGVERGTFYDLRRTFQTVAEETLDFPAVKFCMGHAAAASDMSSTYRQVVTDERIQRVCNHVREWLFAE